MAIRERHPEFICDICGNKEILPPNITKEQGLNVFYPVGGKAIETQDAVLYICACCGELVDTSLVEIKKIADRRRVEAISSTK